MIHEFKCPIKAFLDSTFVQEGQKTMLPCLIVGVNCYPNETLTFMAVINNGLYYELPFHAFNRNIDSVPLLLRDQIYSNCKSNVFEYHYLNLLKYGNVMIYRKHLKDWVEAVDYFGSFDFYQDNDLLHLFVDAGGYFYAMPNHKILLNGSTTIPKFIKQRIIWRV